MKFYSGFSFTNEEYIFDKLINKSDFCICGFSYGAIRAFDYVQNQLESGNRVDILQLFSPVFFQDKNDKFKKLQLNSYIKNKNKYLDNFISSCFYPLEREKLENKNTNIDELKELLEYRWNLKSLEKIFENGVAIEVYLGENDKIINSKNANDFFKQVASVIYIKNANHFLQGEQSGQY